MNAPAFSTGAVVRCRVTSPAMEAARLQVGHIYTVAGIEAEDMDARLAGRGPLIHLAGISGGPFPAAFFSVAFAAPANDAAKATEIAARMADEMRARVALTGACTVDDLARAGFTAAQILEFADDARGIACIRPSDGGEAA